MTKGDRAVHNKPSRAAAVTLKRSFCLSFFLSFSLIHQRMKHTHTHVCESVCIIKVNEPKTAQTHASTDTHIVQFTLWYRVRLKCLLRRHPDIFQTHRLQPLVIMEIAIGTMLNYHHIIVEEK